MSDVQNSVIDRAELERQKKQAIKQFIIWVVIALTLIFVRFDDIIQMLVGQEPPLCYWDEIVTVIIAIIKGYKLFAISHTFNGLSKYTDMVYDELSEIDPKASETARGVTQAGIKVLEAKAMADTIASPKAAEVAEGATVIEKTAVGTMDLFK